MKDVAETGKFILFGRVELLIIHKQKQFFSKIERTDKITTALSNNTSVVSYPQRLMFVLPQ